MGTKGVLKLAGVFAGATLFGLSFAAGESFGQTDAPATHTIFMTGMEIKGATTTDKLAPPPINPADLSKGYGFKAPGDADKGDRRKWEVASYVFVPSFVVVRQGDTVKLTASSSTATSTRHGSLTRTGARSSPRQPGTAAASTRFLLSRENSALTS